MGLDENKQAFNINADIAAGTLAISLKSRRLMLMTDVEGVYIEYGTPQQRLLTRTTPSELENIEFSKGSMSPKVEAACLFVRRTGNPAVIGALEDIDKIVKSEAGTLIEPDPK